MTEQQAPTLREALASQLQHAYFYSHGLSAAREGWLAAADVAIAHFELAKNIDTASPSPASLHERMKTALIELFHAEWSPGGHRYVEAQTAALRLGEELATPQPSPTGPREGEPPECDYEACKRAHACKFYPCRAPETASPSPASLQEAAISPSGIKTPPDEQIVAAWNAWPKTAITSRRSAIEFVRAVLSQRSADSPLASPVEAQELEDDPEAEAAFHMGYGGEAQETATPSLPDDFDAQVEQATERLQGLERRVDRTALHLASSLPLQEPLGRWPSSPHDDYATREAHARKAKNDSNTSRPVAAPSLPAVLTDATCRDALLDRLPVFAWASVTRPEVIHHAVKDLWLKVSPQRVENYIEPLVLLEDVRRALATSATPVLP